MSNTCIVTGAAGFIGSQLSDALLSAGWRVIGIDALDNNYDCRIKEWNLESLKARREFQWIHGDLMEIDLTEILKGAHFVFHLAARPGVRDSWGENYRIYDRQNVLATQRLLEACIITRPRRLIYASSSSVYGEMPGRPVREDDAKRPMSPYGVSKLAGEHLVMAYHRCFKQSVAALRYFTVYGPRQRPDMAFHRFFRAIMTNNEILVFGDGNQTRDVTFVGDIVHATIQAMDQGSENGIYNIGGGHRVSINEILKTMEKILGQSIRIKYEKRPAGDPLHTGADIALARREISFKPKILLEEGLREMALWMDACLRRGL
ncbi:MAG: GDP-mannose 4,6-dehydratase [Candidatus Eisenbacteria bacterium]|uniref:GDP-mannose 4,6-dehydratase n=1 Tax=Eiseniibacteriota bacterium TaxID=2212470 RepID=A0A948S169_UNCEI|nr:GDP-mannose 4,6-dehydratase [Candidatus Eisenbacteria bacterium]MBU1950397.1 GDP-mannose 4,6-dehydratase [Candidatus Eisenbacteria bacterium]MBU2692982.1 GDP-mannose 4,6-dehydratase [Candidatus Eisenbacteria bacterium]